MDIEAPKGTAARHPAQPANFPMIDALRGFAAISVVAYHVVDFSKWTNFPHFGPLAWFRMAHLSVDLFFVISGFVIAYTALYLRENNPRSFYRQYAQRRIARVVPLYLLTLLAFLFLVSPSLLKSEDLAKNLAIHLTFTHNFVWQLSTSINGSNWSIATEMQFYALIALTCGLIARTPMLLVLIACVAIAWSWRYGVFISTAAGDYYVARLFVHSTQVPGMLDEFGFGIALAVFIRSPHYWLLRKKRAFRYGVAGIAVMLLTLAIAVYWSNGEYWHDVWMVTFFRTLFSAACAAIVLTACNVGNPLILDAFGTLRYLGVISYGIYLWHLPVFFSLQNAGIVRPDLLLCYTLLGAIVLAIVSWHLFEKPLLARFGRLRLQSVRMTASAA